MLKGERTRLILSFMALLVMLAWAATAPVAGAEDAAKSPLTYDPKTVETVQGIVVSPPPAGRGLPEPVVLTLKTDRETLTVWLGPNWFVESQGFKITALDRVKVTGSRILVDGRPTLVAREVKKGAQVLKLRDEQGKPLWYTRERN